MRRRRADRLRSQCQPAPRGMDSLLRASARPSSRKKVRILRLPIRPTRAATAQHRQAPRARAIRTRPRGSRLTRDIRRASAPAGVAVPPAGGGYGSTAPNSMQGTVSQETLSQGAAPQTGAPPSASSYAEGTEYSSVERNWEPGNTGYNPPAASRQSVVDPTVIDAGVHRSTRSELAAGQHQ